MKCEWHTCENILSGRARRFCSPSCKNKFHVVKNRKTNKRKLIDMMGGCCVRCGYNKSMAALTFHHPDNNKEFGIASKGHTKSFDRLVAEASKCVLLCANCHAEEHEALDGNGKVFV